ncbi:MAG: LLM class flavin-dependent oxidoreductase [Chloroflexota bacterium]|nr:LLM class flavin-dependent oxidoreductase [Dehalococcoidia bacterium]MDW8253135.1 LLM class flavin-dependent oxidoreductase [Chloroflexota bacterium]
MTKSPRIGVALPSLVGDREATWEDIRAVALAAERAGIDSVWYLDHFFLARGGGRLGVRECWTVLSAIGALTERVRIGSLVLCQSFRHPALLAKAAATLQEVTKGRLILGLGAGWFEEEYREYGFPFDRRVARLEEYVAIVIRLLAGETVSFRGRFFALENARLSPPPPPTPVWLATLRPRMNALLGRVGDGWNGAWYGGNVEPFRARLAALREEISRAGRDPAALELSVGVLAVPIAAAADAPRALAAVRRAASQFAPLTDEELRARVFIGRPDEIAALARRYGEAGADTVILSLGAAPFAVADAALVEPTLRALAG